jgi:hypothetical protein
MYKDHPDLEKPKNENAQIWRYMDFTKFVSLLDKSALFFSRSDKLGDSFEGSYSKANIELRPTVYGESGKGAQDLPARLSNVFKAFPRFTLINSWHLNEYESAALWKLYLKSNDGIAVQSTFKHLRDSLKHEKYSIFIGKVKYIDYEKDWLPEGNTLYPYIYKRKSFEHEQELRAIIQEMPSKNGKIDLSIPPFDEGLYVSVDLKVLIDRIYLAPACPKWLFELTESVTKKYGVDKEVKQSSLDDIPVY